MVMRAVAKASEQTSNKRVQNKNKKEFKTKKSIKKRRVQTKTNEQEYERVQKGNVEKSPHVGSLELGDSVVILVFHLGNEDDDGFV